MGQGFLDIAVLSLSKERRNRQKIFNNASLIIQQSKCWRRCSHKVSKSLGSYALTILKNTLCLILQIFLNFAAFERITTSDWLNHTEEWYEIFLQLVDMGRNVVLTAGK